MSVTDGRFEIVFDGYHDRGGGADGSILIFNETELAFRKPPPLIAKKPCFLIPCSRCQHRVNVFSTCYSEYYSFKNLVSTTLLPDNSRCSRRRACPRETCTFHDCLWRVDFFNPLYAAFISQEQSVLPIVQEHPDLSSSLGVPHQLLQLQILPYQSLLVSYYYL